MCVFRKRGGAANTGPGRVTALDPVPRLYIAIISSRGETALRIKASQRRPGKFVSFIHFDCFVAAALCKSSPGTTPLELFIFLRGPFSPIHSTLFPLSLSASPFLLFLSFVSNVGGENLVRLFRRSVPPSIILLLLSPLPCVSIESF